MTTYLMLGKVEEDVAAQVAFEGVSGLKETEDAIMDALGASLASSIYFGFWEEIVFYCFVRFAYVSGAVPFQFGDAPFGGGVKCDTSLFETAVFLQLDDNDPIFTHPITKQKPVLPSTFY